MECRRKKKKYRKKTERRNKWTVSIEREKMWRKREYDKEWMQIHE